VDPPSSTNLFGSIYYDSARKIEVSSQVTPLRLSYLKRPTKPSYATTGPVNGQYIYSDSESTDVGWSASLHDILVQKSLGVLGLSMRDGQVQRAGQEAQPKENTL